MQSSPPCWASASWQRGGGVAVQGASPEAAAGRYLAYSVTKLVIATLVLQAAEQRLWSLDDPAAPLLPHAGLAAGIRLRHLLSHTAGIVDYGALPAYHAAVRERPGRPWSVEELRHHTLDRPLLFAPGQGWAYSNPGYAVLRLLLEVVHGRTFGDIVRAGVCEPLGLAATAVVDTPDALAGLMPAESALLSPDGQPLPLAHRYHPGWVAHGVIATTAGELVRLVRAVLQAELTGAAALHAMMQLHRVPGDHPPWTAPSYGLGLMADPAFPGGPVYGHNGGGPGYSASVFARWADGGPLQVEAALCTGESTWAQDRVLSRLGWAVGPA